MKTKFRITVYYLRREQHNFAHSEFSSFWSKQWILHEFPVRMSQKCIHNDESCNSIDGVCVFLFLSVIRSDRKHCFHQEIRILSRCWCLFERRKPQSSSDFLWRNKKKISSQPMKHYFGLMSNASGSNKADWNNFMKFGSISLLKFRHKKRIKFAAVDNRIEWDWLKFLDFIVEKCQSNASSRPFFRSCSFTQYRPSLSGAVQMECKRFHAISMFRFFFANFHCVYLGWAKICLRYLTSERDLSRASFRYTHLIQL